MNLVFFGSPSFAVPTLKALNNSCYNIIRVVTTPDKKAGRGLIYKSSPVKTFAKKINIPILSPTNLSDPKLINELCNLNIDYFIVVAFKILPEILLGVPKHGSINLHASLLPKYRGAAPVNHAILNGDKETGLTTFIIEKKVDRGDILMQSKYKILNNETAGQVLEALSKIGSKLIIETLECISKNIIIPKKQNNSKSTLAPKIIPNKDCRINWNEPAINIHNKIRAYSPTPGAFTYYKKKRIKLFNSSLTINSKRNKNLIGKVEYDYPFLKIYTLQNILLIKELQLEGKNKLSVSEFICGHSDLIGYIFE